VDDHDQIIQQLYLYSAAVDSRQWHLFDDIFTKDIFADYGQPVEGLEPFKQMAQAAWGAFDASQHSFSNVLVKIEGNSARSLAHGNWHIIRKGFAEGDTWVGRGWYDDSFVKSAGRWMVHNRRCRVMSYDGNPGIMFPDGKFEGEFPTTSMTEELQNGTLGFFA